MAVILRENFWALAPILFFPFKNNRNPKFPGASHPKMSYFFGASRPKYWGGANSSQGAPIFHCPKWGFIFVQDRAGPQKVSGLFQTIIPPLSHNTPPCFATKIFGRWPKKKWVFWMSWNVQKSGFRRLRRQENFGIWGLAIIPPLVSQHLETRGGIMAWNSPDRAGNDLVFALYFFHDTFGIVLRAPEELEAHIEMKWSSRCAFQIRSFHTRLFQNP